MVQGAGVGQSAAVHCKCVFRIAAKLITLISPFTAARTQHLTVVLGAHGGALQMSHQCAECMCVTLQLAANHLT